MKKIILLLNLIPLLAGCSTTDDGPEIDCALFDPLFPSLYVRLVDANGVNLIENGTIDPEDISVEADFSGPAFYFVPENEFANADAYIREFDNSLSLFIPHEPDFRYTIHLNDTEAIDVNFMGELTKIPCDISYYTPTEASFNGQPLELKEISRLGFLVVIEL